MLFQTKCTKYIPRTEQEKRSLVHRPVEEPIRTSMPAMATRDEREPKTHNNTFWGESKQSSAPPGPTPVQQAPQRVKSYSAASSLGERSTLTSHWCSSSHADFPVLHGVKPLTKELQIQRATVMRTSDITLGASPAPPDHNNTNFTSFQPYERDRLVTQEVKGKNMPAARTHSDVVLSTEATQRTAYQPMTMRQFQPHAVEKGLALKDKAARAENQRQMMLSHFPSTLDPHTSKNIGPTQYTTVAAVALGKMDTEDDYMSVKKTPRKVANPTPKELKEQALTLEQQREQRKLQKLTMTSSNVPLMGRVPIDGKKPESDVPHKPVSVTKSAFPVFHAPRLQSMAVTNNATKHSFTFGGGQSRKVDYSTHTRTAYRGIVFDK